MILKITNYLNTLIRRYQNTYTSEIKREIKKLINMINEMTKNEIKVVREIKCLNIIYKV